MLSQNCRFVATQSELWYLAHRAVRTRCYARPEICKGGHVVNHQNVTPEIRSKRVPRKAVIVFLITVCILLASLLVLQTMRLQREQERVSVAEATVDRAQELLDLADGDLEQYCATVREYYAEKNHPVFAKIRTTPRFLPHIRNGIRCRTRYWAVVHDKSTKFKKVEESYLGDLVFPKRAKKASGGRSAGGFLHL